MGGTERVDYFQVEALLKEEEKSFRDEVRRFVEEEGMLSLPPILIVEPFPWSSSPEWRRWVSSASMWLVMAAPKQAIRFTA